jgi:hypothetical protein
MIEKLKKLAIIITVAILFTIFVFAMTNAFYPRPEYDDFCEEPAEIIKPMDREKCGDVLPETVGCRGPVKYEYDEEGCPIKAECDPCFEGYESARERYNLVLFIVASIAGIIAILFGLFYKKKDEFWEIAKGGFLLGGLISLFVGTAFYYENMGRFLRPAVILIELFIVLLVTYKVIRKKKK